jgi:UDP-3-O-[3-hydroxymyristoyl] glucosamine N-acyltransferase
MTVPSFIAISPQRLSRIAIHCGAEVLNASGDPVISSAGPIEATPPDGLTFLDNPKYLKFAERTAAAALFTSEKFATKVPPRVAVLRHKNPYRAYATALALLYPTAMRPEPVTGETGVSPHAHIAPDATIEDDVIIEAGVVIGRGAAIGRGARILANAVIGANVQIGRNSTIGVGAAVQNAFIGNDVILHPGVRIGQDGFGFAMGAGGHLKIPQIGRVIIQDKVEIGANSTVDRGANRDTVIGEGTKIDNLVQIGHNVVIGRHCVIVGLAGIAGSATLGDYVVVAGQAGIVGHHKIGDGAQIGGGAGVKMDVPAGEKVIGYPAVPVREWLRQNRAIRALVGDRKGSERPE